MKLRNAIYVEGGVRKQTRKLYGVFADHLGIKRRLPLFTDRKNAAEAARAIERLVNVRASGEFVPPELQRFIENTRPAIRKRLAAWGIIDATRVAAVQALADHLAEWEKSLEAKGNTAGHVKLVVSRARALFDACGFVFWSDVRPETVQATLAEWRQRKDDAIGVQTSNFYLQAAKQFCRWMVRARKAAESPLSHLSGLNVKTDRRHDRRAYGVDEFRELLAYLAAAPVRMKVPADERALVYRLAVETGLRRGAIAALTKASFRLDDDPPSIHVPAGAKNKYRHERLVPLRASMASLLRAHLATKLPAAKAFNLPPKAHGAKMIKADLDAARAAWIAKADTDEERLAREASNFLRYEDDQRRFLDFHSFRHTRGVWLFEHHDASPREMQELLGVGSLALVDRYTKSFRLTDFRVVERGPDLAPAPAPSPAGEVPAKTGTTDSEPIALTPKTLLLILPLEAGFGRTSPNSKAGEDRRDADRRASPNRQETAENAGVLTSAAGSVTVFRPPGEVAEWLNAPVSKTGWPAMVTGVRISPSPLKLAGD